MDNGCSNGHSFSDDTHDTTSRIGLDEASLDESFLMYWISLGYRLDMDMDMDIWTIQSIGMIGMKCKEDEYRSMDGWMDGWMEGNRVRLRIRAE
jgi:hypothetical protein